MVDFVIGVDVHKRSHTCAAVDANGRQLATKTVASTTKGHEAAIRWARTTCTGNRRWGVEDVRGLSGRLEAELLDAGEEVVRVPPKLTARQRQSARTAGKSDPIDALAVARAVLREPDLPVARHDSYSSELRLLIDRRDDLVTMRTALTNRVLSRLHQINPEQPSKPLVLRFAVHRKTVAAQLDRYSGLPVEIARDELTQIALLSKTTDTLEKRIKNTVETGSPALCSIYGCGTLMAAKIIGETADITRFATEAKYARFAGVAPVPNWSGASTRLSFTRSGNRQLNRALYGIAMIQIRRGGRGEPYYRRRIADGDTHRQAIRCLKRQICRAVYNAQLADAKARQNTSDPPSRTCSVLNRLERTVAVAVAGYAPTS